MSRRRIAAGLAIAAWLAGGGAVSAQDAQTGSPPERIDLTIPATPERISEAECRRRSEAALVSGEIVVCGSRPGEESPRYSSREEAQDRYAAATMGRSTPDVAGPGIFRGKPTFSGLCVKGILNCPKPPALMVDVTALPAAPPGSDADRIARGLPPLGEGGAAARAPGPRARAELGLPPAPAPAPVNPAESAAPAAPR